MNHKRASAALATLAVSTTGTTALLAVDQAPAHAAQYPKRYDSFAVPSGDYGYATTDNPGHWWRQLEENSNGYWGVYVANVISTDSSHSKSFGLNVFDSGGDMFEGCSGAYYSAKGNYYKCDYLATYSHDQLSPQGLAFATHPAGDQFWWNNWGRWRNNQNTVDGCVHAIATLDSYAIANDCFN